MSSRSVPAPARALFEALCAPPAEVDVPALRDEVVAHLEAIRAAARQNELLPVDIAEVLAAAIDKVLADLPRLSAEHGALVIGAARYFCADDDYIGDVSSVLGLDDDVAVFNHVVRRIGRTDLSLDP